MSLPFTIFDRGVRWLGGGMFVAALAYCVWWYCFVLARPDGPLDWRVLAYDFALFGAFALHHSVFARDSVKARLARVMPPALVRSVYVWIASGLLIAVCALWRPTGGELYDVNGWRAYVHAAVQLAGVALIASSTRVIDALILAGIRQPALEGTLQITGPYRWVRHPIYLGWVVASFGAAHMTVTRFAFAVISSFYLVVAVRWEERSLAREFPVRYAEYARRVKWRLAPYIY